MDKNSVCYKVKANIGDMYSEPLTHEECVRVPNSNTERALLIFNCIPGPNLITLWSWFWFLANRDKQKPCK